jgi:hypothetical protein
MSVSTDAILCYGIDYGDKGEFPWGKYESREWYYEVHLGYQPPFQVYDSDGHYLNEVEPDEQTLHDYFAHRHEFEKAHPMPFEVVTHCSNGYPEFIIAVPGTVITASRGYPESISLLDLRRIEESCLWVEMNFFLKSVGVETRMPQWILASYWW